MVQRCVESFTMHFETKSLKVSENLGTGTVGGSLVLIASRIVSKSAPGNGG